jgi:hypothetical protein
MGVLSKSLISPSAVYPVSSFNSLLPALYSFFSPGSISPAGNSKVNFPTGGLN